VCAAGAEAVDPGRPRETELAHQLELARSGEVEVDVATASEQVGDRMYVVLESKPSGDAADSESRIPLDVVA
jgi:hypothetical protein